MIQITQRRRHYKNDTNDFTIDTLSPLKQFPQNSVVFIVV